ncbi:MAG: DUF2182 domain-containing protein [Pseudomonadota bacterium]
MSTKTVSELLLNGVSAGGRGASGAGWIAVYLTLLAAWVAAWLMDPTAALPEDLRGLGVETLRALCLTAARDAALFQLWLMWAVMGAAMMLPTAIPALRAFAALSETAAAGGAEPRPGLALGALAAGYLAVWAGFAAVAAAAQAALSAAGWIDLFGRSTSLAFTAALLALAGLWQFSALKDACLTRCRAPGAWFVARWQPGPRPAFAMGLNLGAHCLGCCWALMGLALIGGTMSLAWMGAATLLMTLEKLPDIGRPLTRPLGAGLLLAATGCALGAATGAG